MRFNNFDGNIPGQTFQFPTSTEGVLGYNNAIVLTQPMHIDDLKYLRNPIYAYGNWLNVGQTSKGARFLDNPGDPANWSNSYTQYIAEAAWKSYQIHGGQPAIAAQPRPLRRGGRQGTARLLRHQQQQAHRVRLGRADRQRRRRGVVPLAGGPDGPGRVGLPVQRRAGGGAGLRGGRQHRQGQRDEHAGRPDRRTRSTNVLWNPNRQLFENRMANDGAFNPWKEINIYYPFAVGAIPNTTPVQSRRCGSIDDPAQYPIFPFYTANQADKNASGTGSNNFSTINSTVQFRLFSSVLRNYPQSWINDRLVQEAAVLERLGAVRQRQHPVAGRQRVLGQLERLARSPTAPGSTTTSWAAATGP